MRCYAGRRGIASVIGTMFFVVVFMLALGAMAYESGLQAQTAQVEAQAQALSSRRGEESLGFGGGPGGLMAVNEGPSTLAVEYVVLRFPNGTVYPLATSVSIPTSGMAEVEGMVPSGVCTPGGATCLSKYDQIVQGDPPGSSVGLVTSLGNSFWYTRSPPPGQSLVSWVRADVSTSGKDVYTSTTLAVTLSAGTTYVFTAYLAVEPLTGIESYDFEVHALPQGASLVIACAPLSYPEGGGNQPTNCVGSTGAPVAVQPGFDFGVAPPVFETPGVFGTVKMGATAGVLQLDFACTANCGAVSIKAGSYMTAEPQG
ncbi:MAG: hypothetical protein JRN08_02850 [Nitrososphaerota archaeon]|nr:hypothetical protein [Nitrososphaerota archaeon]